ncbi:MAG TPA: TolC family protein, partial [Nitrococcus sp.]|nr:TolC family protein [Nitrococcus sp.]
MDGFAKRRAVASRWLVALAGLLTFGTAMAAEPVLSPQSLVTAVLKRNPGIAAMQAAVDAADARIEQAGALDDPMLSYTMAPGTFGAHGQSPGQSVEISQSFPWPGMLDLRADAARAAAESAQQQLADTQLRLAALTRAAYAKWYYVFRALAINAGNQDLVERLANAAGTAYSSGATSQQDVLQAEVELTRLKNQALELHSRRRSVQAEINGLLNRPPRVSLPPSANLPPPRSLP